MGNSNGRQSGSSTPRSQSTSSISQPPPTRTFDGGSLTPHGIYPGTADYNPTHVLKYVRERRLAPFYKGLDDYEEEWTDYQLSCFVKEGKLPATSNPPSPVVETSRGPSNSSTPSLVLPPPADELAKTNSRLRGMSLAEGAPVNDPSLLSPGIRDKRGRPRAQTVGSSSLVPTRGKPLEAVVYRGAIECPFYPPNINRTRCCWKPICTECFVEMKRSEPHYPSNEDSETPGQPTPPQNLNPMNLVSDPVRCPFCVKSDFGVVYNPPAWLPIDRKSDTPPPQIATSPLTSDINLPLDKREEMYPPGHNRVVLSDNIRPDWYQALAHRRRVEARRLATATALQQALAVAGQRRRSSGGQRPNGQNGAAGALGGLPEQRRIGRRVDGIVRITRDEADEMMLQEAIRQSLMTQEEERQKRDDEERKKAAAENADDANGQQSTSRPASSTSANAFARGSPTAAPNLPRLQQSMSTSPPSPRSFLNAFRARSSSASSRNGSPTSPTSPAFSSTTRRPSSTNNLYPPVNAVRRQPSLPDSLLTSSTSPTASESLIATAMHDSIIPSPEDTRPPISSPLASQVVSMPINVSSADNSTETTREDSTRTDTSVSTSSPTEDDEILPVTPRRVSHDSTALKIREDAGSVEQRELVEEEVTQH